MTNLKIGPVEVWLTQANMQVTCRLVFEDESTQEIDVDSLSMRGAQREVSGWLVGKGYRPDGRWASTVDDTVDGAGETWRRFRAPAEAR